jgi:hypothetical protein
MYNNLLAELSLHQIKEAITIREKIESLEKELNSIVDWRPSPMKAPALRKKRRFSTAARTQLASAMKGTTKKGNGA